MCKSQTLKYYFDQKRRSARHTNKRKKYLDDIDLNLSDDEGTVLEPLEGTEGPVAMKTVCVWIGRCEEEICVCVCVCCHFPWPK